MTQLTVHKLLARFLFSILAFALSLSLTAVVAVTQIHGGGDRFSRDLLEKSIDSMTGVSNLYCALNHESVGICTYAYFLGGVGIVIALIGFWYTFSVTMTNIETPIAAQGGINLFGVIWWFIGSVVLSVFSSRIIILPSFQPLANSSRVQRMYLNEKSIHSSILTIAIICTTF